MHAIPILLHDMDTHMNESCHMSHTRTLGRSIRRRGVAVTGTHQYTYYLYYLRMWATGWLRSVGSLKSCVSFAKEPYKRDDILRKELVIFRSLLIVATPYLHYYPCYYRMYILLHITTPCILPHLWREYQVPITGLIVGCCPK